MGGAGCREPPPLACVSPSHGSLPRTNTWDRSRGPRLLRMLLSSKVRWKQARQSGLGMGAERGQLGRVSHPGTPGTGPSPTHLSPEPLSNASGSKCGPISIKLVDTRGPFLLLKRVEGTPIPLPGDQTQPSHPETTHGLHPHPSPAHCLITHFPFIPKHLLIISCVWTLS